MRDLRRPGEPPTPDFSDVSVETRVLLHRRTKKGYGRQEARAKNCTLDAAVKVVLRSVIPEGEDRIRFGDQTEWRADFNLNAGWLDGSPRRRRSSQISHVGRCSKNNGHDLFLYLDIKPYLPGEIPEVDDTIDRILGFACL